MKLNLGSGKVYRLGSVNVDMNEGSVADERWDAMDLPLDTGSVELIEADQLIEHFDWVHCKHLLLEWARVLAPGGKLIVETPELVGSFKRMKRAKGKDFFRDSQWLFGISSPGQSHGICFKRSELYGMLRACGFADIEFQDPRTYLSEPGLRAVAVRTKEQDGIEVEALFRKELRKAFKDDSYQLIPLEPIISDIMGTYTEGKMKGLKKKLAGSAFINPSIPSSFIAALRSSKKGTVPKGLSDLQDAVKFAERERLHERAFTVWTKRKKDPRDIEGELQRFIEDLGSRLLDANSKDMGYIIASEPAPIGLLCTTMIAERAMEWANIGVKAFHTGDMKGAIGHFERSLGALPGDPWALWNLSRALYSSGKVREAMAAYEKAANSAPTRALKRAIEGELGAVRKKAAKGRKKGPVDLLAYQGLLR